MGLIAKILSFTRTERNGAKVSDVKVDPGGGPNITAEHFAPPGDDSFPLKTDFVYADSEEGTGRKAAIGYVDPINEPKSTEGEKRLIGRDPATGLTVVDFWLKSDGSIIATNANGSFELQAGGDFVVNGATITVSGDFVDLAGKVLRTHTHAQPNDSDGDTEAETAAPS